MWTGTGHTGVVKAWEAAYCTFPHIHYFIDTFLSLSEILALEIVLLLKQAPVSAGHSFVLGQAGGWLQVRGLAVLLA